MKPEYQLSLKTGRDEKGYLEDWVNFEGPLAFMIPVLEEVLRSLRALQGVGVLPDSATSDRPWPFGSCGATLVTPGRGAPCVRERGHSAEPRGDDDTTFPWSYRHTDATGISWWAES